VNEALDETESKAWQKLLSVMTHEIMNSIAPISSLAETMLHRLQETSQDIGGSTGGVGRSGAGDSGRSGDAVKGLLKFAETYRNLNKITTPESEKDICPGSF
jgi:two-component system nitrogen regulation sensor histidine kinase NtrY